MVSCLQLGLSVEFCFFYSIWRDPRRVRNMIVRPTNLPGGTSYQSPELHGSIFSPSHSHQVSCNISSLILLLTRSQKLAPALSCSAVLMESSKPWIAEISAFNFCRLFGTSRMSFRISYKAFELPSAISTLSTVCWTV